MGRRNQSASELVTGIFVLAVLAVLVYFTIVISGVDLVFGRERRRVDATFDQVGGLKEHDSVMYRGTKVGSVERIVLSPTNLTVVLDVDRSVVLRAGYRVSVRSLSLLGGNYLELEEGAGEPLDLDAVTLRGEPPIDWMRDISQVAANLNRLTGSANIDGIVSNLLVTTERVRTLAERLERGEGLIGRLMSSDETLYVDLKKTLANASVLSDDLRTTAANAAVLSERLKNGEGTIGKLMRPDDPLHDDLLAAIASFRKSCESFDLGDAKTDVGEILAQAKTLVGNLSVVAERLKDGKGTLGKLASDEQLYNEVNGLIRDIRQVVDNYRDTTPISTFSSLATGAL